MSPEGTPRRLALVHAGYGAAAAAPAGVDRDAFAWACLADCYEVAADLVEVGSGIAGPPQVADLLWPGAWHLPDGLSVLELARTVTGRADELVVLPADAPDLPGLVLAKIFRVLHRVDLAVAPQRNGVGCVAIGVALPPQDWLIGGPGGPGPKPGGAPAVRSGRTRPVGPRSGLAPAAEPGRPGLPRPRTGGVGTDPRAARGSRPVWALMLTWDQGGTLADRFRSHAGQATHLYGHAMRAMADDWEAGGPVRTICAGYEQAPHGSALPLRLLAGVFRLVLTDQAPELLPFYPCLGGDADPAVAWPVLRSVIARHPAELRAALEIPPQTNEVGRSVALLAGLFDVVAVTGARHVQLLELGASAGLNLLIDRFGFRGPGWAYGDVGSPVTFDDPITGDVRAVPFVIVDRRGCDLHPVDAASPEGRLLLTSFVWPFDISRHQRLAGALQVAAQHPVRVDRAGAAAWLADQLERSAADEALPVVWHSITQLYWPTAEIDAVDAIVSAHGTRHPLARVAMEFGAGSGPAAHPELRTTVWQPGQEPRHRRLGTAHDHGPPVRLDPDRISTPRQYSYSAAPAEAAKYE